MKFTEKERIANQAAGAWVRDRVDCYYSNSRGERAVFDEIIYGLWKGEHLQAHSHGELDDIEKSQITSLIHENEILKKRVKAWKKLAKKYYNWTIPGSIGRRLTEISDKVLCITEKQIINQKARIAELETIIASKEDPEA